MLRLILAETLMRDGFDVQEADCGDTAWNLIQRGERFDVLLTDVRMPGTLNGIELARRVKARKAAERIVVMSAFSGIEMERGLGRFIAKPFSPLVLAAAVAA